MRSGDSRSISAWQRPLVCLLSLALPGTFTTALADVRFQINHPATGNPLPGHAVTIVAPGGAQTAAVTDADGAIELTEADGDGWTARFTVEDRTYTAAGTAVAAGGSSVLLGVLTGLGAVAVGAAVTDSDSDKNLSDGGSDPGDGGSGPDTGGGIDDADSRCTAVVEVLDAQLENPGNLRDAPEDGDLIEIGVLGDTTLFFDIDLFDLTVSADLSCSVANSGGLSSCSGDMIGTFNTSQATIMFTEASDTTVPVDDVRDIQGALATLDVIGLTNEYSTTIVAVCL
jgi:hypothetical protein